MSRDLRRQTHRRFDDPDNLARRVGPFDHERTRLGRLAARARYPSWQFGISPRPPLALIAFRPHPDRPTELQMLGPWPLPEDAGEEEVRAAVMLAIAETDGPDAVAVLTWLPAK